MIMVNCHGAMTILVSGAPGTKAASMIMGADVYVPDLESPESGLSNPAPYTWCPPPGVDFLLDFCIAELGGVVVESGPVAEKPHSDNRNEGQQSAISPSIWGDE
jgi:hypothetical protein